MPRHDAYGTLIISHFGERIFCERDNHLSRRKSAQKNDPKSVFSFRSSSPQAPKNTAPLIGQPKPSKELWVTGTELSSGILRAFSGITKIRIYALKNFAFRVFFLVSHLELFSQRRARSLCAPHPPHPPII